jgi:DNA-binding transcriptional MerR regulator
MKLLLAPRDAGRRLRLTTSRLAQLDREGIFRAIRDSAGRRLYTAESVERFALEREKRRASALAAIGSEG